MTKYREIIRLHSLNFSERNIALSCSVSRNTALKLRTDGSMAAQEYSSTATKSNVIQDTL